MSAPDRAPGAAAGSASAHRRNLLVLVACEATVTASLTLVVPFLPLHIGDLGVGPAERQLWAGLALVAPAVALAVASPLWGRVGDRLGRRWMIVRALVGIGVALLAMAVVTNPAAFVACRLVQGGLGGATDAAAAFLVAEAPPDLRGRALGRLHSATAVGALAGPLAGGLLAGALGYRLLFAVAAVLLLASALLAGLLLQERSPTAAGKPGPAATTGARSPRTAPGRPGPQAAHRGCRFRPGPVRRLLGDAGTRATLLAGVAVHAAAYGLVVVFAPHVATAVGERAAAPWVGILQAVTWAAAIGGAGWWGRRNDAIGPLRSVLAGAAGCTLALAAQAPVLHPAWYLPARLLQGLTASAVVPSVYLAAGRAGGDGRQGAHVGTANSLLVGGHVTGGLLGGGLSSIAPTGVAIGLLALLAAAGTLTSLWSAPRGEVVPA